ncbi:hypothetical protein A1O7_07124 [Cladophialophora yegresii CBS 114405]|uniref:Uncharacterized protein n=1 Tax=Cladophialophora yegresii CBS 114405 TaxID=1182544 RepID=W9VUR4_9EURO|nr:uncharacterized protein A1O7_07124 [Cladophialophora yegresii CBS 114405]EXJ56780.1 hypothetical protein A1O7_07124 [Cladophialophora yegresii CBS 114405]
MSQTPNVPSVISNAANARQQVPLRDYLNARVAPFLKKAITESLNAEAEFPLQWLGECLIHQSFLYEGNSDRTNIRERFLYKFDDPKPVEQAIADSAAPPPTAAQSATSGSPQGVPLQEQPEVSLNEASDISTQQAPPAQTNEISTPQATVTADVPPVNGIKEEGGATHQGTDGDTDMGGTS